MIDQGPWSDNTSISKGATGSAPYMKTWDLNVLKQWMHAVPKTSAKCMHKKYPYLFMLIRSAKVPALASGQTYPIKNTGIAN